MSCMQHFSTRQAYIPYVLMVKWLEVYLAFYTRDLVENTFCFSCMEKCASCCMTGKKKLPVWKCIKCAFHLSTTTVRYPGHGATMHLKNRLKRKQEIVYRPRMCHGCKLSFWRLRGITRHIFVRIGLYIYKVWYIYAYMYIYICIINVNSNLISNS